MNAAAQPGSTASQPGKAAALPPLQGSSLLRSSSAGPNEAPTVITNANALATPPFEWAGKKLGPYELICPIGAGGMAAVVKATDTSLGRTVALKILPPETAKDADAVTRFRGEALAAARLDHDSIARAYASGEDQGLHYIAFEYVEGKTLRELIDEKGTILPADCIRYMQDVAAGLEHAASRGVIHRDVKPSNVIITPAGRAKLVDMGLARRTDPDAVNGGVTQSGTTLGTFDYISPEQALDPRRADSRSDIYSLGCTAYHALTGRPPVPEGTAARKLHAHQHIPPIDPRLLNPQVSDELAAVLGRMMAKNPADRYASHNECLAGLQDLALQYSQPSFPVPRSLAPRMPFKEESPKWLGWFLAAVVLTGGLVYATNGTSLRDANTQAPWEKDTAKKSAINETNGGLAVTPPRAEGPRLAATVEEFSRLIREGVPHIRLESGREYDLTTDADGLTFTGLHLTLEAGAETPAIIRVCPAPAEDASRPGTFTVSNAETVRLMGVVLKIVDAPGGAEAGADAAMVLNAETITLDGCRVDVAEGLRSSRVASLVFSRTNTSQISLTRCLFSAGAVGMRLAGKQSVTLEECAFGPHDAVWECSTVDSAAPTIVMKHSSVLFKSMGGALAEVTGPVTINISHCLFASSGPGSIGMSMPDATEMSSVLIHTEDPAPSFRFSMDAPCAVYRVEALIDAKGPVTWNKLKEHPRDDLSDKGLARLTTTPWVEANPIVTATESLSPWNAFRARVDTMAALRAAGDIVVLGVRYQPRPLDSSGQAPRIYAGNWPPALRKSTDWTTEKIKIWWPKPGPNVELPGNASPSLSTLLAATQPGDEIQIHHDGEIPFPPAVFLRPGLALTIRPHAGTRPILVSDTDTRSLDATLFQVADGTLTLENLHLKIQHKTEQGLESKPVAAVRVAGGASAVLRQCIITINSEDETSAAVILSGIDSEMRLAVGDRAVPHVRIENTLIRGKGRGVVVTAGRGFALEATNMATALDGAVIFVDPPMKEALATARGRVSFTRVTTALGGSLLELKANRGVYPIEFSAERSVFAPINTAKPMMRIEGGDPSSPDRYITWQADQPNLYANFDRGATILEIRPVADATGAGLQWDSVEWLRYAKELGRVAGRAKFSKWPEAGRGLLDIKPNDLVVTETLDADLMAKPGSVGVDAETLPKVVD